MKSLFNILHFGIIGTGIGSVVTTVCTAVLGEGKHIELKDIAIWLAASFLIGVFTSILYSDKLNLFVLSLIHVFLCFVTVSFASYFCNYASGISAIVKSILPIFVIVYFIVYALVFTASKINEKEVNTALNKSNN